MSKPTDEEIKEIAKQLAETFEPTWTIDGIVLGYEMALKSEYVKGLEKRIAALDPVERARVEDSAVTLSDLRVKEGVEETPSPLVSQCGYCGKWYAHIDCDCQKAAKLERAMEAIEDAEA